jgi:hypothetical protein
MEQAYFLETNGRADQGGKVVVAEARIFPDDMVGNAAGAHCGAATYWGSMPKFRTGV